MVRFKNYEKLTYKICWYYAKKYEIDYRDLLSEAWFIFQQSKKTYDKEKSHFSHHYKNNLRRLNYFCKKEKNIISSYENLSKDDSYEYLELGTTRLEEQNSLMSIKSLINPECWFLYNYIFLNPKYPKLIENKKRKTKFNTYKVCQLMKKKGWPYWKSREILKKLSPTVKAIVL
ncbi:MAG: hypothetical protein ACFFDN_04970 [Candidatus Hodarchaeota archaeon]